MRRTAAALAVLLFALPASAQVVNDKEKADGFAPLFDGKTLDGWKVYAADPVHLQVIADRITPIITERTSVQFEW